MIARLVSLFAIMLFVTGCSVVVGVSARIFYDMPPEWTWDDDRYNCGDDIEDVENLTGRRVQRLETVRGPYNHAIREDDAVIWLGFEDGKLRYYQITWPVKGRMAELDSGHDVCENKTVPDISEPRWR